jgi:hypothetical protein
MKKLMQQEIGTSDILKKTRNFFIYAEIRDMTVVHTQV